MSRDSAAVFVDPLIEYSEVFPELHSLDEGIAVLSRFEEILAELELALGAIPLSTA